VIQDESAPGKPKVLRQSGSGTFPWCVRRGISIEHGFVEVKFKALSGKEDLAANSMILHELYFDSLGGEGAASSSVSEALGRDFGSFERWREQFVAMGKALGGGSGWVLLTWSPRDRRLMNQWAADHTHALAGATPVLALDMYEHSYHIDFGAKAAAYVDAFMENIAWPRVAQRVSARPT